MVGIPANIAAIAGAIALILQARGIRYLRTGNDETIGHLVQKTHDRAQALQTPSGDPIGAVTERTHDITHATNALVRRVDKAVEGDG